MTLANLSIYQTWKNKRSEYNNNKLKISAPTWNDTFDLSDGSYSISDIQGYFEFIIKKHEALTENPPIQVFPKKIKIRIVFKIKTSYKLELLTPEIMRLLGSTKQYVDSVKIVKMYQYQNLLFYNIVIQSKMIINIHQKFYSVLFRINNLDN